MKLLLITSTYPSSAKPHQGVFNSQLVNVLAEEHSICVIAPIPWTERTKRNPVATLNCTSIQPLVFHPTFYYPPKFAHWTYGWWYWQSIRSQFHQLTQDFKPDVVLGYWAHPDSDAAVQAARSLGVPSVVMVGGTDIRILAQRGLRRRAIRSVLQRANQVVAFSRDLSDHVVALGVPSEKVQVVYRGVDSSIFFPGDRNESRGSIGYQHSDLILLWIGRLVEVKNPQMAIRALAALRAKFGDRLKLVMIGEGPLRGELERLAIELGVQSFCQFVGAKPHTELPVWYRAANLTILTSLSEGIPNVLRESIACDLPFVATDVGGICEIADPSIDTLVPLKDETAFQNAIAKQLECSTPSKRPPSKRDLHALGRELTAILEGL